MGVAQTGQVDEPDAVLNAAGERSGECQRDRGFANAARTNDGQEAPLGHQRGKFVDQLVAPEDPRPRAENQRGMRTRTADLAGGRPRRTGWTQVLIMLQWRYELVAAPGDTDDIADAIPTIAQHLAQCCHVDAQRALFD